MLKFKINFNLLISISLICLLAAPRFINSAIVNFGQINFLAFNANQDPSKLVRAEKAFQSVSAGHLFKNTKNLSLARITVEKGAWSTAENLLLEVDNPYLPMSKVFTGFMLSEQEEYLQAAIIFDELNLTTSYLIKLESENDYERWFLSAIAMDPSSHLYLRLGLRYARDQRITDAIDKFNQALLFDNNWRDEEERAIAQYNLALRMNQRADLFSLEDRLQAYERVFVESEQLLDRYPLVIIHQSLVQLLAADGNLESAVFHQELLTELDPTAQNWFTLGQMLVELKGDVQESYRPFENALFINTDQEILSMMRASFLEWDSEQIHGLCDLHQGEYPKLHSEICLKK